MNKDYYKILELDKKASIDDIKSAFKKMAKKYHPDKNKGSKESEEKFKEINEAYEILSDPEKKNNYDKHGDPNYNHNMFGGMGSGFREFRQRTRAEQPIGASVSINIFEAFNGVNTTVEFLRKDKCSNCSGEGFENGGSEEICQTCKGAGEVMMSSGNYRMVSTCHDCRGSGSVIKNPCKKCNGSKVVISKNKTSMKLPKGIQDGSRFAMGEIGNWNPREKKYGDVIFIVAITNHDFFELHGNSVACVIPITVKKAMFGGETRVPSLHGELSVKIPKGTNSGSVLKVKGKGFRDEVDSESFGDMFVKIIVEIPDVGESSEENFDDSKFEYKKVSEYNNKIKNIINTVKNN